MIPVRLKDKRVHPFFDQPYRDELLAAVKKASSEELLTVTGVLFLSLWEKGLPDMMIVEMPEIPKELAVKLVSTVPNPKENYWGMLETGALDMTYRNRCFARSALESLCNQLDSKNPISIISLSMGAGHLPGVDYVLRKVLREVNQERLTRGLPELQVNKTDYYSTYIKMGIPERIKRANSIREKIKGLH